MTASCVTVCDVQEPLQPGLAQGQIEAAAVPI